MSHDTLALTHLLIRNAKSSFYHLVPVRHLAAGFLVAEAESLLTRYLFVQTKSGRHTSQSAALCISVTAFQFCFVFFAHAFGFLSLLLSVVIVGVKALQIVVGFSPLTEGCLRSYSTELIPFHYNPSICHSREIFSNESPRLVKKTAVCSA